MKVRIKKLNPKAVIPSYAKSGDAGMDLTAIMSINDGDGMITYHTGLAIEIPEGYVGLIFPRSSIYKYDLTLANSVGVIDSGYRGEIMFKFRQTGEELYNAGDRVGQLIIMPYPQIELTEVEDGDNLSEHVRGNGGFGHTGK